MKDDLTLERLRQLLLYIPETGKFIWLTSGKGKQAFAKAGRINNGYRSIKIDQTVYYAHRLAWLWTHGEWPTGYLDHINLDRSDNRICNLRLATHSQNSFNRKLLSNNKSGFQGVCWIKSAKRWRASIRTNGRRINLGQFRTLEEASAAYRDAAETHFGDFANKHSVARKESAR